MSFHQNSGSCPGCLILFKKYPDFWVPLQEWFFDLQSKYPSTHVSCAGRGKEEQERAFQLKVSNAHWTRSSHNWNAAIDIFFMDGGTTCYDPEMYRLIVEPALTSQLLWYGRNDAPFRELPHVEVAGWYGLAKNGILKLVE